MAVLGEMPQINDPEGHGPLHLGPMEHALAQGRAEELREQGQEVDLHH
jgi:hypothetical protein